MIPANWHRKAFQINVREAPHGHVATPSIINESPD